MSIENKISLLWNCALALKNDQQTHKILKSYYINTCRSLSRNSLLLPKEKLATSQMCSHCGYFWYEGKFRTKSIPKRKLNNVRAKKLIEKLEKNNSTDNGGTPLNKSQRKRAKWLKKCLSKRLEITCENCRRKSTIEMENPKNKSGNKEQQELKDSLNTNIKIDEKPQKNSIGQKLMVSQKPKIKASQQKTTSCKELKAQPEGKKNKKKNNITANKVISKTQSQNNLLQLAGLLKKNPQQVKSNTNKLDSFLK